MMEISPGTCDPENGCETNAKSVSSLEAKNSYREEGRNGEYDHVRSAHRIGHDPWYQLGVLLAVSFNCGYILSYSNLVLKNTGWTPGIISMIILALLSFWANCFLAKLHIIEGKRFIRYRDIMEYAFGRKVSYLTCCLQFTLFILANMGFLLLAGRALKQICISSSGSLSMTLPEAIIICGIICFLFSMLVPNISRMRIWSGISAFLTMIYIVIVLKVSISDGTQHSHDYKLIGTTSHKIFNILNGISAVAVMNNSAMVLELQATLKQPAIQNMWKALGVQFSFGLAIYYVVTIIGYWAYGSSVSEYLLNDISGPRWAKLLANGAMVLQTIVSQHLFCAPVHETFDTHFSDLQRREFSSHNISVRIVLRGVFFLFTTSFAAMFPFIGDFVSLGGSLCCIPLTFILPSMIYIKVKGQTLGTKEITGHYLNVIFFSVLAGATFISSCRSIINNARKYHLFANT